MRTTTGMTRTAALGLVLLLGWVAEVQAKGPATFRNQAVQQQLRVRTVAPKAGRSYLQRASSSFADNATFQGYSWVRGHAVKGKGYRRAHLRKVDQVSSTSIPIHDPGIQSLSWGKKAVRAEVRPGTDVPTAAASLVTIAGRLHKPAMGLFNGTLMVARPGESAAKVQQRWDARAEQKYARYRARMAAKRERQAAKREQRLNHLGVPLVDSPPAAMTFHPASSGFGLRLITPGQLRALPKGTVLTSISGAKKIVGVDRIDGDTRSGFLAFGFAPDKVNPAAVLSSAAAREQRLNHLGAPLVDRPPATMTFLPGSSGFGLRLITPGQLRALPKGTVLTSIDGAKKIVGVDYIDGDTRGGFLAFGFAKNRINPAAILSSTAARDRDRPGAAPR